MSDASAGQWDHSVDLLIVGTGAGAMVAALAAHEEGGNVLLIEKSPQYGGSSAMSGGGLWIPNNHLMEATGISDSREEAMEYMKATTRGLVSEDRLAAYVDEAPKMAKFLDDKTRVELVALDEYPDYYQNEPGSKEGARAMETKNFHGGLLGDEFLNMREIAIQALIMGRIFMTIKEARLLFCKGPGWIARTMKLMAKYWLDIPWRFKSSRDRNCAMGNSLVGMLRLSLMDRKIPLWLNTPAKDLIVEGDRIVGVLAEKEGKPFRIQATKGVILGTGGFESSQEKREKYLPNPTRAEWTCGNPYNTGDAVDMGLKLGAGMDLMDDGWWGPTTVVPGEDRARMLVIEKSLPGGILVNKAGKRFVNEAMPYIDVVNEMYANNTPEAPSVPAYLIFDATFRKKYPCGPMAVPGQADTKLPKIIQEQYLKKADTLEGVAKIFDIDAEGLQETVRKFNEYARAGKDPDFNRGDTVFDRYYGDPQVEPNPSLGPIETPPFDVLEAFPGDLGTKGGLKTNAKAQVLKESGDVIPGLYAIGNCSASVMGRTYPGPGATIGPASTFGYIAARHAMAK